MSAEVLGGGGPVWDVTTRLWLSDASVAEVLNVWYALVGILPKIVLAVFVCALFKLGLPALSFCFRVASAVFVDGDANDEWQMTMRRSKEVKEQQKRLNAERERDRQAQKAAERERRRKKVPPREGPWPVLSLSTLCPGSRPPSISLCPGGVSQRMGRTCPGRGRSALRADRWKTFEMTKDQSSSQDRRQL